MPTVNKRVLLRLVAVFIVLAGGLAVLHAVQAGRIPDALRWQAERATATGKLDRAIFYLRQYLEFRPGDHAAAIELGDTILKRGGSQKELSGALFVYERVAREAPDREDVRRKLVDLCTRLNRNSDALIHIEALLQKQPAESKLWEKMGISHAAQNRLGEARDAFEKAIKAEPSNVRAYELLAQLLVRQLQLPDAAEAMLDRMTAANPNSAEAFLVRARYLKSINKSTESLRDLDRLMVLSPEDPDGLLLSAEILQTRGDISRARQTLASAVDLYPRDVRMYRALSWLEVCLGNLPGAVACLERGAKELPHSAELLTPLADLLIQQGELERVKQIVAKLETRRTPSSQVPYLRARMMMQQGKWSDAIAILEPLRTEAVAMPGLAAQLSLLLSVCHEQLGDAASQAEALRRVLAIDPSHLAARLALGTRHVSEGRWEEAIKEYSVAAKSPYAPLGAFITLGRLRLAKARAGENASDEFRELAVLTERLTEHFKQSAEPVILKGEFLAARGEYEKAEKYLRAESGRKLNDPRIWVALANVVEESRGRRAALDVLDEAQSASGDSAALRIARGRLWVQDAALRTAGRLSDLERGIEDLGDAEQLQLLNGLAELYANSHDAESLQRTYRLLAARQPRDVAIRRALGEELSGESAELGRLKNEIRALEGERGLTVPLMELRLQAEKAEPNGAEFVQIRTKVLEIQKAAPDRADAHFVLARMADRVQDTKSAAEHYARAVDRDRSSLQYLQSQFAFLLRSGQDDAARRTIERLWYDPRLNAQRLQALLEGAFASLTPEQAGKCVAWLEPLAVRQPRTSLWLARFLINVQRDGEALAFLRRSAAGAADHPDLWIELIGLLAAKGNAGWELEIKRAQQSLSREQYCQVCAACLGTIRSQKKDWQPPLANAEERRLFAQACVELALGRGERDAARLILQSAVADASGRPEDAVWAKRNLAMLALQTGRESDASDMLKSLRADETPMMATLAGQRERASVLLAVYRQVGSGDRAAAAAEALKTLRAITAHPESSAKDWYTFAQVQRQTGDRAGYRASLSELMKREPDNLFYVSAHADELLADNDLDGAAASVRKLEGAVHDLRAAASVARYYCMRDVPSRSLETVEKFLQASDPGTPDAYARLRQSAELLDGLARLASMRRISSASIFANAAIESNRQALRHFPEETERVAALLATLNQASAAIELIEQMKNRLTTRAVAAAGLAALRAGTANPRQFATVRQWIDAAVEEQRGSLAPRLQLAEWHTLRQDYVSAEETYRAILKAEPNHVVALNNLAWVLAARSDKSTEALELVDRAIRAAGPSGELLDTRARILIAAGKYDRAVEDLNDALNQSQTSLRYFHLAVAQLKQSKREDALSTFKKAKARGLDPKAIHPSDLPAYKLFATESGS